MVEADSTGTLWIIKADWTIWKYFADEFVDMSIPGVNATDLVAGPKGKIYALGEA